MVGGFPICLVWHLRNAHANAPDLPDPRTRTNSRAPTMRVFLTILFLGVAGMGSADMRGEVICGVPPDEAVAFVYEWPVKSWEYIGIVGNPLDMGHPSAQAALDAHAPDSAEYVCEVEILDSFRRLPAQFYRLHHPFIERGAVNEEGEPLDWDYDPRQNIIGIAAPDGVAAPDRSSEEFSQCIAEVRRVDEEREMVFVRLESTCKELAYVRFCLLSYFDPMVGAQMPRSCADVFLAPGEGRRVTVLTTKMEWQTSWTACAGDRDRAAEAHECYFE